MDRPAQPPAFEVSRHVPGEEAALWQVFFDATHLINGRDYTPAQCERWAPLSKDMGEWSARVREKAPFVVREAGEILGFGELEASGHIDYFYVHHAWQRRGVGRVLYAALEREARRLGLPEVFLESSLTAMPFFAAMGFRITEEQVFMICDAPAKRFLMRKGLPEELSTDYAD